MAEKVIFATDSLVFDPQSNYGGMYGHGLIPAEFALELNKRYIVAWDGNAHTCQAQDGSAMSTGAVAIGSLNIFGGASNGEPFAIVYVPAEDINIFLDVDGSTAISHAVTIYQIVEEETKIIVKDRNGTDVEYSGVASIRVSTSDGGTKDFVDADSVPDSVETTVALDFSGGDMVVTPDDGTVYEKVSIQKPETLIPENIAEGVDIAGIVGAFAGSGGSMEPVKASGSFKATSSTSPVTITHNLGFIPDIIVVVANSTTTGTVLYAIGFRGSITPAKNSQDILVKSSSSAMLYGYATPIDQVVTDSGFGAFKNANESTIQFGGSLYKLDTNVSYSWSAVRFLP